MKFTKIRNFACTALLATTMMVGVANAETATIPATATVLNAITMDGIVGMDFGTLIIINDNTTQSTIVLDTAGTLGAPTNAGATIVASIAGTPAAGAVNVTAGNGTTVNISVNTVTNPVDSGTSLIALPLSAFSVLVPGGTEQTIASDGSQTRAYTADGTAQTVAFGATLSTPSLAAQIPDDTYTGSFIVTAAY